MNIFITGVSSGIGNGLAKFYLNKGETVFGVSRRETDIDHPNFKHLRLDLTDYPKVKKEIPSFIGNNDIELAILNAGALGKIQPMIEAKLEELKGTMEINLWSQKVLLDTLLGNSQKNNLKLETVVGISSGAGVRGNLGWSGYSLSKAALNMLIQLYAAEFKNTRFYALAPGLVDTSMQDILWDVSEKDYPSVKKLHDARGTENMPGPKEFAPKFEEALSKLKKMDSGSFADARLI